MAITLHNVKIKDIEHEINGSSLDDAISTLKELREEYWNSYEKLHFEITVEDDADYRSVSVMLVGERKETEEEKIKRETEDRLSLETVETYEKAVLAKLLAKYGTPE